MPKTRLSECPKTLDSSSTLNVKVMSHEMIYELHKTIPQSQWKDFDLNCYVLQKKDSVCKKIHKYQFYELLFFKIPTLFPHSFDCPPIFLLISIKEEEKRFIRIQ